MSQPEHVAVVAEATAERRGADRAAWRALAGRLCYWFLAPLADAALVYGMPGLLRMRAVAAFGAWYAGKRLWGEFVSIWPVVGRMRWDGALLAFGVGIWFAFVWRALPGRSAEMAKIPSPRRR